MLLRGDNHFCSHEFMDRVSGGKIFVDFITGISSNQALMKKVDKLKGGCRDCLQLSHPFTYFGELKRIGF